MKFYTVHVKRRKGPEQPVKPRCRMSRRQIRFLIREGDVKRRSNAQIPRVFRQGRVIRGGQGGPAGENVVKVQVRKQGFHALRPIGRMGMMKRSVQFVQIDGFRKIVIPARHASYGIGC